ncbi:MAG: type II toxin-antitoxin system death-on-curing family toxin [Propionivibrio sp.]|nr:type II toxin-antitoxin system death-on-curing family toxin [Propionivibrio sp.]
MIAWRWIEDNVVLAVHEAQLAEHGGLVGVRDTGLLSSALSRPRNLAAYGSPDAADLAAAYAFGLVRNHPFIDGNKRAAFVCAELCLVLNGYQLMASDAECVTQMLRLASGSLDEPDCAAWLRASSVEMQ